MAQKAGQSSVWSTLSALDAFPKVNEDFFKKTMSGGEACWRCFPAAAILHGLAAPHFSCPFFPTLLLQVSSPSSPVSSWRSCLRASCVSVLPPRCPGSMQQPSTCLSRNIYIRSSGAVVCNVQLMHVQMLCRHGWGVLRCGPDWFACCASCRRVPHNADRPPAGSGHIQRGSYRH